MLLIKWRIFSLIANKHVAANTKRQGQERPIHSRPLLLHRVRCDHLRCLLEDAQEEAEQHRRPAQVERRHGGARRQPTFGVSR